MATKQSKIKLITTLTPAMLRKKMGSTMWVMPYNRLTAIVDRVTDNVLYLEEYGPQPGFFIEGWRALHFPRTSPLVTKSYREGPTTAFIIKQGEAKVQLTPSFAPIGISACRVIGKNVAIRLSGLGGGGVSASYSRGMADGVKEVRIIKKGGGTMMGEAEVVLPVSRLLLIAVDDTDIETEGATYSLVHNIAVDTAKKFGVWYAIHNNIQLFPYNPHKTKNCMSTVIGFIYPDGKTTAKKIHDYFAKELKTYTLSKQTAFVWHEGFEFNHSFKEFATSIKFHMIENIQDVYDQLDSNHIGYTIVSGDRGLIGATAALALFDDPEFAAKLPTLCR